MSTIMATSTLDATRSSYAGAKSLEAAQAAAFSANGFVFAALDEGRSMSAMPAGGSPISLRPTEAAVAPLNAIALRSGKS